MANSHIQLKDHNGNLHTYNNDRAFNDHASFLKRNGKKFETIILRGYPQMVKSIFNENQASYEL